MKRKEDTLYYTIRECALMINKTPQTIFGWIKISNKMKEEGKQGFMPEPTIINNTMHYSKQDIDKIKVAIRGMKKGDMLEYRDHENSYSKLKKENQELKSEITKLKGGK